MKRFLLAVLALGISASVLGANINDAVTRKGQTSRYEIHTVTSGTGGTPVTIVAPLGGGAEAGALLVTVANDSTGVLSIDDNGASITVDSATFATEVTLLTIDADTGNIATSTASIDTDTTTIAGDTTSLDTKIITGGGAEVTAVLVTMANDSTGVLSIDDNAGSLTVDGTVAATQSGAWNITNISGTVSLPTGAATESTLGTIDVDTGNIATSTASIDTDTSTIAGDTTSLDTKIITGGGAELGAVLVTVANDSTGVLSVDDNGASLTVDGTVAATQSGTWNITNVSGTVSLPTGAATETTLGTIDVDTGNIATSTASIDTDTTTIAADTTSIDADTTAIELNTDSPTAFASATFSVGTSALEIAAASTTRRSLLIRNADSNTVLFVGPTSGVTTANGIPLNTAGATGANGNGGTIIYTHTAAVWGIVSAGTADTRTQSESD